MTERSKGIVQKQTFLFSFLERKVYAEDTFSLNQYNVFKPLQSTKIFKIKKKKKAIWKWLHSGHYCSSSSPGLKNDNENIEK